MTAVADSMPGRRGGVVLEILGMGVRILREVTVGKVCVRGKGARL